MKDAAPITEAARLKALAHPIRWQLLGALRVHGTATATQCSAQIGESVASCSYHLNMLAKYGFVTHAEGGQGREKPWRLVERQQNFDFDLLGPEEAVAAEAATDALLQQEFDQLRAYLRVHDREPDQWRRSAGLTGMTGWLTAEEATELREGITALFDRFNEREARGERPSKSRPVRFELFNYAVPGVEETP